MEAAPHQRDIAGTLNQALRIGEEAFFNILNRAQPQGELPREKDPRTLARFFTAMLQGTIVMSKAGTPDDSVKQTAETALAVLE